MTKFKAVYININTRTEYAYKKNIWKLFCIFDIFKKKNHDTRHKIKNSHDMFACQSHCIK